MLRLKFVFDSYLEMGNTFWCGWQAGAKIIFVCRIVGLCRSVWCLVDWAVIQRYIFRGWKAGAKNVFVFRTGGLCRSVWCRVERTEIHWYILWPGLIVNIFLAYITGQPESDTLWVRFRRHYTLLHNCTIIHTKKLFAPECHLRKIYCWMTASSTKHHTFLHNPRNYTYKEIFHASLSPAPEIIFHFKIRFKCFLSCTAWL